MKTICDVFNKISFENNGYSLFSNCVVTSIKANKEDRTMFVYFKSDKYIKADLIKDFTKEVKQLYQLNKVRLIVQYINVCVNEEVFEDFIEYCNYSDIPVDGFFNNCKVDIDKNKIKIEMQNGGKEFFEANIKHLIENLLNETFNTDIELEYEFAEIKPKKEPIKPKAKSKSNVIMGEKIKQKLTPIQTLEELQKAAVCGTVFNLEVKELKIPKHSLLSFNIYDDTGSITVRYKDYTEKISKVEKKLSNDLQVVVKGQVVSDDFLRCTVLKPTDIEIIEKETKIKDEEEYKRVELHAHTTMSAMDGLCDCKKLIERAIEFGHRAIAITDHGVLQAFPDAMNASKRSEKIKVIYGVEAYFVNDTESFVFNKKSYGFSDEYVVFDFETTGLSSEKDEIIEIGAVKIKNGEIIDRFSSFVKPEKPVSEKITQITGIKNSDVENAPKLSEIIYKFKDFIDGKVLVAHNAQFDMGFLYNAYKKFNIEQNYTYIDTVPLCRAVFSELRSVSLSKVAKHLNLTDNVNFHRACDDAEVLSKIFLHILKKLKDENNIDNLEDIEKINNIDPKRLRTFHLIILVKNQAGLKNLYKLVSMAHLQYFNKRPIIPKSELIKHREGLIIGSACEAGEVFTAILNQKSQEEIESIASFYDYLEIQPTGNNMFLIREEKVNSVKELEEINIKIVELAKKSDKPFVATGDVHFLNAKDEEFRRIIMAGQGYKDADNQPPLYFRTTKQMIEEFTYLSEKDAYAAVVENTNLIADMCEKISPVPKETYPPEIKGAEEEIIEVAYKRMREIYGDTPPKIVEERMKKELDSIIKHGFSIMYYLARRLVLKSNEDGYLVGSRGSVGSSLLAFFVGITEVNALCPHYVCPNCKNSEFFEKGEYPSGVDLPDKDCPVCKTKYKKDGFEIPFETFLGFDGDKAPDIDLNFSGEYQARAHKYTEVLCGAGNVFRAGTIGTIAAKTAFGYVKKYLEERDIKVHKAEVERLVNGCTGIKRTTGQHPGGVMIVPYYKEIYDFTAVNHPADDMDSDIITTHFDYHAIHDNLLKLDILGHDDPTMIKMLEDLTKVDAKKIPLDDKKVMSIFTSDKVLNIKENKVTGGDGTIAIPEFGTKFVRQMLADTKPTTFAELVRISGLSHGEGVWVGNAKDLVANKVTTLSNAICTRDDIMEYLIRMNMDKKTAFNIMESVRKGKGLTPDWIKQMKECNVPDWYITSCQTIGYMFPKAHAVAYVTMAFRIAWFKVYYPLEFYAAYFSIRAGIFESEHMIYGPERVLRKIKEIESNPNPTAKEKDMLTVLEVCYEMYMRGFEFLNIDLYESDAKLFLVKNNKLLPPLNSLAGVGDNAAENIYIEAKKGTFTSIEELKQRTGISVTAITALKEQGILDSLPESNQLDLFSVGF